MTPFPPPDTVATPAVKVMLVAVPNATATGVPALLFTVGAVTGFVVRPYSGGVPLVATVVTNGTATTTSVDLSNTYLDWAHENLLLNGFGGANHELYRADCLHWLEEQPGRSAIVRERSCSTGR